MPCRWQISEFLLETRCFSNGCGNLPREGEPSFAISVPSLHIKQMDSHCWLSHPGGSMSVAFGSLQWYHNSTFVLSPNSKLLIPVQVKPLYVWGSRKAVVLINDFIFFCQLNTLSFVKWYLGNYCRERSLFFLQTKHKSEIMIVLKYLNKCITEEEKNVWFQLCIAEKCIVDCQRVVKEEKFNTILHPVSRQCLW
jgi:hypothetical protein